MQNNVSDKNYVDISATVYDIDKKKIEKGQKIHGNKFEVLDTESNSINGM